MSFISAWFGGGQQQDSLAANSNSSTASYTASLDQSTSSSNSNAVSKRQRADSSSSSQGANSPAPSSASTITAAMSSYLSSFSAQMQQQQPSEEDSFQPHAYSNQFLSFIKSIGDISNKSEQDDIMEDVLAHLKEKINATDIENLHLKEYIIQMIYCEMFGYDTEFGYLAAINLASSEHFHSKRIGYLFVTHFIPIDHELTVMMIGTLQKDLQNTNFLIVDLALRGVTRLLTMTSMPALEPQVKKLLTHHKPVIRKRALLTLYRCYELRKLHQENQSGPIAALKGRTRRSTSTSSNKASRRGRSSSNSSSASLPNSDEHDQELFTTCQETLCDSDVQVMNATIIVLYQLVSRRDFLLSNQEQLQQLVPSLVSILNQIAENRLDKSYMYHRLPAPWLQIRIMKILSILGHKNKNASLQMYEVLREVARRADIGNQTGNSVLYEAVRCMSLIYPNKVILNYASEYAESILSNAAENSGPTFSSLENQNAANLRYVGLQILCNLVQAKPEFASKFQHYIVSSLESTDEALLRKALDLLFSMTNHRNASIIVKRMISILRSTLDHHFAAELTQKIFHLALKYAPDAKWFLEVSDQVLKMGHAPVQREHIELVLRVIGGSQQIGTFTSMDGSSEDESDISIESRDDYSAHDIQVYSVDKYFAESLSKSEHQQPLVFLEVIVHTLGAYGHLSEKYSLEEILLRLCDLAEGRYDERSGMLQLIVYAMMKLVARSVNGDHSLVENGQLSDLLLRFRNSSNVDLQQRCYEFLRLKQISPEAFPEVMRYADQNDFSTHIDTDLAFLNQFVQNFGGEQYDESILEAITEEEKRHKDSEQLKLDTTPAERLRGYFSNAVGLDLEAIGILQSAKDDYEDELILKPSHSVWGDDEKDGEDSAAEVEDASQNSNVSSTPTGKTDTMQDLFSRNFRPSASLAGEYLREQEEAEQEGLQLEEDEEAQAKKREKAQEKWGSLFAGLDTHDNSRSAGVKTKSKKKRKHDGVARGKKNGKSSHQQLWSDEFQEEKSDVSHSVSRKPSKTSEHYSDLLGLDGIDGDGEEQNPDISDLSSFNHDTAPTEADNAGSSSPLDDFLDFDSTVTGQTNQPLIASPSPPHHSQSRSSERDSSILTPKQAHYNPNAFSQRVQREMANYPPQPQLFETCAEDNEIAVRYIKAWKPRSLEIVFFLHNKNQKLSHIQFLPQTPEAIFVKLSGDRELVHIPSDATAHLQYLRHPNQEVTIQASLTLRDCNVDSSFVGTIQYQTKANPGTFQSVMFDISIDLMDILRPDISLPTTQFASLWPKLDFERQVKVKDLTIDSVKDYVNKMKQLGLHIIDIKGNEVIASTRVLDLEERCLVHVKVNSSDGQVQFTCKSDKKNIADSLLLYAERQAKSIKL